MVCSWTSGSLRSTSPSSSRRIGGIPLPLVYGWNDQDFVPDADTSNDIAKDLVEFSKLHWTIFASTQIKHESETVGEDREVRLPHATASVSLPQHSRPHHEQFEPNLGKPARDGPYGKDQGGKGQHKGKGKGQSKGKGKQGKSPPGGVTFYDYVGQSGWSQGYHFTWYWNQQRGWFWRWD